MNTKPTVILSMFVSAVLYVICSIIFHIHDILTAIIIASFIGIIIGLTFGSRVKK